VRRLRGFGSLVIIVAIAAGALLYTVVAGNKPLLGLDLQGGVSVVLKPTHAVENDTLDQAISASTLSASPNRRSRGRARTSSSRSPV
jgi:preprotein translocase subunit SecD